MATYTRPGVYVQEYLNPISDIVANPGDSAAAFVGVSTGGGPVGPTLISSWAQYQALFGGVGTTNDDLGYAVYTYFSNGGTPCYIVRAVNSDATAASLTIQDTEGSPANTLTVTANAGGTWASDSTSSSRVFITIQPSTPVGRFDLTVEVGSGAFLAARETFVDLSMDPLDGRNAVDIVNSSVVGSKYVHLTSVFSGSYATNKNPAGTTKTPLTGGTEGTGSPDVGAAVAANLSNLNLDLIINLPGASAAAVSAAVTFAAASGRHFVVADVLKPAVGETAAQSVTAMTGYQSTLATTSSYVAIYGPWLYVVDPGSKAGALRLTAPGGAVVGQYLRTDAVRGVQKAPAGVSTTLVPVVGPYAEFTDAQQDTLVAAQINLIKTLPGAKVCIWGARTQASGFPDRYVPIRRTLISIKSTLVAVTQFAVFEDNNEILWAQITDQCTQYLTALLSAGALKGNRNQEAFYVTCDATNNTPNSIGAGIVNVEVGVALQNPAEFIVIRLGQMDAGASANDSLDR